MLFVWLLVGFVLLVKGADLFVDGSSAIAKLLKVPTVVIGLTIVALGTSAPEAAVSIAAGLQGSGDMAISNILGSNIFNLLVVVGSCAALKGFGIDKVILKRDYLVCIGATVLLAIFIIDLKVTRVEGLILLSLAILYLANMLRETMKYRDQLEVSTESISVPKSLIMTVIGIVGIVVGGDLVVDNASGIAALFGLSPTFIGLTIVAMGTSLPELVTSVVAAKKGESGLAIGNVVGSNIFNMLLIGGLAASVYPLSIVPLALIDCLFLLIVTGVLYVVMKRHGHFSSRMGIICLVTYFLYMGYIVIR